MRSKVFISYAHTDQEETDWMKKLKKHLGFFERKNLLDIWEDSKLKTGVNPQQQIIDAINESKIVVLLVGPAFLGSGFINDVELPRILEAARADGLQIFPLITGYCSYLKSDLKELWAFNDVTKPLESIPTHEQNQVLSKFCNTLEEAYNKKSDVTLSEILAGNDSLLGLQKVELANKRLTCCNFTSHKNQVICSGFEPEILNVNLENQSTESLKSVCSNSRVIFKFPDSSIFLIGYDNGDVYSFNSDLVNFKKCFHCQSSVFSIDFNSANKTIITTERNGEVNEWTVSNLVEIVDEEAEPQIEFLKQITVHSSNAFMFAYSVKSNSGVSIGADGTTATIDFKTGKVKTDNFYKNHSLYCIGISENGTIAIGSNQGKVFLIDTHFKRKEIVLHTDTVRALALSKNGKWLFTGSKDKTVKVRNLETEKTWIIYKCKDYIYDVKFSTEYNQLLVCDGAGTLFVFNFNQPIEEMNDTDMELFLNTK